MNAADRIDYSMVLGICNASEDPGAALRSFVEQEREHSAHAALNAAADEVLAVDDVEWALIGRDAGAEAARMIRSRTT